MLLSTRAQRPCYAMLVDSLDDEQEAAVVAGALRGARDADATLVCVAGAPINDPNPERRARNFVFDLVPRHSKGVLVLGSAVAGANDAATLRNWLRRFGGLPIVALGVPVEGHVGVTVDNYGGVFAAVQHLIQVHHARRLAFVNGPSEHPEAQIRYQSFCRALSDAGIDVDERLVLPGDFGRASGVEAVRELMDVRRVLLETVDAVVVANDYMAIGAMEEFARRGIRIPEAIAVTGFDDLDVARRVWPALSTVSQSSSSVGREGMRLLADLAAGGAPDSVWLPTGLVIRRSCGCGGQLTPEPRGTPAVAERRVNASFLERRQAILSQLLRASGGDFGAAGSGWDRELLDALIAETRGQPGAGLPLTIGRIIGRLERSQLSGQLVQGVLSALREHSLPCVATDPTARDRLEDAIHEARVAVSRIAEESAARPIMQRVERFREFSSRLRAAMFGSAAELSELAAHALPRLGIEGCIVATLHAETGASGAAHGGDAATGQVLFGFGPKENFSRSEPVRLDELALHAMLSEKTRLRLLLPITSGTRQLGVAALALNEVDGPMLDDFRDICGTLLFVRASVAERAGVQ